MNGKKLLLVFFAVLTLCLGNLAGTEPASAWWRGGNFRGGWGRMGDYRGGFGDGCRWGGCGGVGAGVAAGLAGLAVGAIAGAAIGAAAGGPPAYGCVQHPNYDELGNFVGYSC